MKRPVLAVGNVLISSKNEILLGVRSDNLKWATPGGKVENESVVAACIREQYEETSMELIGDPIPLGYTEDFSYKNDDDECYVIMFFVWRDWKGFPVAQSDHLSWKWFPLNNLPHGECMSIHTYMMLTELLPTYLEQVNNGRLSGRTSESD